MWKKLGISSRVFVTWLQTSDGEGEEVSQENRPSRGIAVSIACLACQAVVADAWQELPVSACHFLDLRLTADFHKGQRAERRNRFEQLEEIACRDRWVNV